MIYLLRKLSRGKREKGQVRIIEAILATFMVVSVIMLVMAFTRPLKSVYVRETADLRRLAYNLLNTLADNMVFEKTISSMPQGSPQAGNECMLYNLGFTASASLPPGLLFKMDVYKVEFNLTTGSSTLKWIGCASNYDWKNIRLVESEPIIYTYVCTGDPDSVRGTTLLIHLVIGYSG
ncbi:hypothetical protein [Infirmifilum sp.]|uniref:hypothetical protein n=1 Tax=Infirmifilum sp. TaxID=2856575 RepID=UPI003D12839A